MSYSIETPNNKDLLFSIDASYKLEDTKVNRSLVHQVRELLERLRDTEKSQAVKG